MLRRCLIALVIICAAAAAQTITDATGKVFPLTHGPHRIVSLAPSLTEEVFALGAGDELLADTNYCIFPAAAAAKPKIGSLLSPNLELVVALHPDIVLATIAGNRQATVDQLRRLHAPVFVMAEASDLAGINAQFRRLAQLLGRSAAGEEVVRSAAARVAAVQSRVRGLPAIPTLYIVEQEPLVVAGHGSFLDEILRDAGAANAVAPGPTLYPRLNRESVLQLNPRAILIANEQADVTGAVASWTRFPGLAAARDQRVFLVSAHDFSTPTPTTFANAVEAASKLLHP